MTRSASSSKTAPGKIGMSGKVSRERRVVGGDFKCVPEVHERRCRAACGGAVPDVPALHVRSARVQCLMGQLAGGVARQPIDHEQRPRQEHGIDAVPQ